MEEGKSLVIGGRNLEELISPLTNAQRDYMVLIVRGVGKKEVVEVIGRSYGTVANWAFDDSYFRELRDYLIENRGLYKREAEEIEIGQLAIIEYGLKKVAEKVIEWEKIPKGEKVLVLKAIEMVKKLHPQGSVDGKSYDELILKMRRDVK